MCKRGSEFSTAGVRQGGVLSPNMFGIYIDDVAKRVRACGSGCRLSLFSDSMFHYADDILLIASSVQSLQTLLQLCESEVRHVYQQQKVCVY